MARRAVFVAVSQHLDTVTLVDDSEALGPTQGQLRGWPLLARAASVCAVTFSFLTAALWVTAPSGYAVISSGPGIDVTQAVSGTVVDPEFPAKTSFMGLTVELREIARWNKWWHSSQGRELMNLTPVRTASHGAAMDSSQATAAIAAARFVTGDPVPAVVEIGDVLAGSPAAIAGLSSGDVITEVGFLGVSSRITRPSDVAEMVLRAGARQRVLFDVVRDGASKRVVVIVGEDSTIGIHLRIAAPAGSPGFLIDGVTGSSAGLAMTLALVDASSPGDLTAGLTVAATGEITIDGEVLPIGGLRQKIASVTARGSDIVFIPADQSEQIDTPGVIKVATLSEAVEHLCKKGATDRVCLRGARLDAL